MELMQRFYEPKEIPKRLALLAQGCAKPEEVNPESKQNICCGPERNSILVGMCWVTFFNLNGIGSLVFYAGSVFEDDTRAVSLAIVFTLFASTAIVGILLLGFVGRKTLMIVN